MGARYGSLLKGSTHFTATYPCALKFHKRYDICRAPSSPEFRENHVRRTLTPESDVGVWTDDKMLNP
jgi:hypothetical protein